MIFRFFLGRVGLVLSVSSGDVLSVLGRAGSVLGVSSGDVLSVWFRIERLVLVWGVFVCSNDVFVGCRYRCLSVCGFGMSVW